ncbi:unnamed protein product, partial [Rotaria magnacalcarata]
MDGVSNPMIGGQYYRTPSIPQISYIPTDSQQQQQQQSYFINPTLPLNNRVPSRPLIATVDFNDDVSQQPDFSVS